MPTTNTQPATRASSIYLVHRIPAGIYFWATEDLCVQLRSIDPDELALLCSWVGQEIDPAKASDLIPAPQSLAWRDIRRSDPHFGESYARQQSLYVHIHASCGSHAGQVTTHERVQHWLFDWLDAARSHRHVQAGARGIGQGLGLVRNRSTERPVASPAFATLQSSRAATDPAFRTGQRGMGLVSFLGVAAVVAFLLWQLAVILLGTREVDRVDLGVVTTAVGGFPIGGDTLGAKVGSGAPRDRMFFMVQVNGTYYPLHEPLVVHQNASLVLRTFANGRRLVCNADVSVCARTADVSREIEASKKASISQ